MSKFKVGDRVRTYFVRHITHPNFAIEFEQDSREFIVSKIVNDVLIDNSGNPTHAKQCRKLVKKVRREFWIKECNSCHNDFRRVDSFDGDAPTALDLFWDACSVCKAIKVREVKE